jgi:hypothetical protein
MQSDFKEVDYEMLMYNLQQNQFQSIIDRLKDVDYANPMLLE